MNIKKITRPITIKQLYFVIITVFIVSGSVLTACNQPEPEPEELIRNFIYENQPVTDEAFLSWAGKNLSQYSSRRVYDAIYKEAQFQAEQGHPTATGVLQSLARAWARTKGLPFNLEAWRDLQTEALENVESSPTLRKLWPTQ